MLQAHANLGNTAEAQRLLLQQPPERLDRAPFVRVEAWLWRAEHGLPAGEVFRFDPMDGL